ncbi:hypothetical protein ACTOB_007888 [Actinoplanes oblitus]|uniref:Uncharacterized protein n=1 Tax=Actinoplanes oblitus TaxID=3040509 RepID=A0ABY8WGY3_9ACTN|nr:hypothetical protein [Actinoplanes oblitus]WIM95758.1 hypothetical protein ACTOB_007888 [Actinoplanes oblitus]
MDQVSRDSSASVFPADRRIERQEGVLLVCDADAYEFYIDAPLGHPPGSMSEVLQQAHQLGLEVLEDEVEFLTDQMIRIWLAPLDSLDDDRNPLR